MIASYRLIMLERLPYTGLYLPVVRQHIFQTSVVSPYLSNIGDIMAVYMSHCVMTIKIRFLKRNSCIIFFDKILCVYSNTQLNIEKTDGKITKLFLEIEPVGV